MEPFQSAQSAPNKNIERSLRVAMAVFAAHFIVVNGTSYDFFQLLTDLSYYIEMIFSSAMALLMITWISRASKRLDIRYGWGPTWILRLALQALLGILIPVLFEFVFTAAYFRLLLKKNILETSFFYSEFRTVVLMICFFNLYCVCRYFYLQWRRTETAFAEFRQQFAGNETPLPNSNNETAVEETEPAFTKEVFIVHTAIRTIPIPIAEIAYFFRERGHVFLRTFDAEDHLLSQSLDLIEDQMDSSIFFRVARHMVVSHKAIVDYRPLSFGKTGVSLSPPYREPVSASKLIARSFRVWLDR